MAGRLRSSVFIPGVALIFFVLCEEGTSVAFPGLIDAKDEAYVLTQTVTINRKLKEKHGETTRNRKANEAMKEEIEEDYPQFDPAPSTKPAVKSGPIVHDTSVMPYVPRSTPPDHPMKGHP
ncbi:hypothetical protein FCM35_KLT12042 [Carex littledalei]|uniref:Uncharacterized protein n=1 Tax=Carex littledalei TaxID=544730 RepID=A0A833QJG5_9POAL|nr:hypothetical protein FCM35_KLT12042 [Carex littledalei]